ncbi:hypothetical protein GMA12_07580 [Kocuria sediminis]|uniref:Uncharacterized protein n=1 Tax=Kocuria sediminis TaxID=1038857 RepID=A0A6N8GLA5_9MICC|nr:hypothetical protein [Kocuria sediminis]MUN63002.1 hypothetical protein [Kocuria sediminis]
MTISGTWVLHYSWGCTGNYGRASFDFRADGTFSGGGFSGSWRQLDGTLLLRFADGPAQYGGTITGHVGTGAMSTFDGSLNGCWYLIEQGAAGSAGQADHGAGQPADVAGRRAEPGAAAPGELDAAGNRI